MDLGLANKRVLVTAGAAGIGRAIASQFVVEGARVVVCDIDPNALQEARDTLGVSAVEADVTSSAAVAKLFEEVDRLLGGLDVLVNNAGISGPSKLVENLQDDEWASTLSVNLNGSFYCARSAIPRLKSAGGGSIINISSMAGLYPFAMRAAYCSAKYGVIGLSDVLAKELGEFNINVNAICPGNVDTPRLERVSVMLAEAKGLPVEEIRRTVRNGASMKRLVDTKEIAGMIAYLCSPIGRIVSGQTIAVDGQTVSTEF